VFSHCAATGAVEWCDFKSIPNIQKLGHGTVLISLLPIADWETSDRIEL